MLESYARHIIRNQNAQVLPSVKAQRQWDEIHTQTLTLDNSKAASLLQSKWGQGSRRRPSYNIMCPKDGNYHCITGCVATAMAAVIHYWKYPVVGGTEGNTTAVTQWNNEMYRYKFRVDSNKFVYDSMPNQIDDESDYAYKHAIGKLMYAVGVTVKMNWGTTGSSATTSKCVDALWRYFCYSKDVVYQVRGSGEEQDSLWNALLHSEIVDNGRPVIYRATAPNSTGSDANHAFVVCGVSGNYNRYYINWGWDGSSNGFFTLTPVSSIEPVSGGDTYTDGHAMVHHIYPDTASTLGILDNTELTALPAYPNPARGYVMIPADLDFNAILTVYNAAGALVDTKVIPAFTKEYRLDLTGYPAGVYLYRLNGKAGKLRIEN